jgi:hypothetical protein
MSDFTASFAHVRASRPAARSAWRDIMTALVAERAVRVRRRLAHHGIHIDETAIVNGPYRRVGLSQAAILPFTD